MVIDTNFILLFIDTKANYVLPDTPLELQFIQPLWPLYDRLLSKFDKENVL